MNPADVHLFRVNNRNIWKRCEICLKLPIKTPERRHCLRVWCLHVFIVNIEHISHLFQMFLVSILKKQMSAGKQYKMDRMMYTFVKITVKLGDQGQIWIIDKRQPRSADFHYCFVTILTCESPATSSWGWMLKLATHLLIHPLNLIEFQHN